MTDITEWTVLLVDDEPDSLNLLHDILVLNGATAHRASSGSQCLRLLETLTPTLIIADLSMPKPDGWDILSAIRANPALAHVPVVAVTAYYSDKISQQAYQAGFDAFVSKPIRVGSFLETLKQLVG